MSLARAIATGDLAELPSRRDEDWRWTDLRGLLRALPPPSPEGAPPAAAGAFAGLADEEHAIVNGRGPARLSVGPGERRVIALRIFASEGAGAHAARVTVEAGASAELILLESYEAEAADYVSETDLSFALAEGAAIERVVIADEPEAAVSVSRAEVTLSPRASFRQAILATGARRQRLETSIDHRGGGASLRLDGLYVVGGKRHSDLSSFTRHSRPGGASDQLVKGVATGQGRGVFRGRILVDPGADKTDARMAHHALVLSDRAEVDAKPELEIYADDVACAHGNSVGALDPEALFYARARGLSEDEARAILIEGFLAEVVERIGHAGAREAARAFLGRKLAEAWP